MKKKERIDVLLVEQGLCETRERAKRAVMAGLVYIQEERVDKAGEKVDVTTKLTVKGDVMPYVSRGGYKLEKAIKEFHIDCKDKTLIDIGSSTGGFTDCALQNGAKLSYAVDVGYNQLAWKLRQDERVEVMERTNFRYCTMENFAKGQPNLASIDVSFISLRIILPVLREIISDDGDILALVKPQFEAGKDQVGKKGIIREKKVHNDVVTKMIDFTLKTGFDVHNITFSPIKGGDGNIEFLMHLKKAPSSSVEGTNYWKDTVARLVDNAHDSLKKVNEGADSNV